jgi:heavy metal efflux system protein
MKLINLLFTALILTLPGLLCSQSIYAQDKPKKIFTLQQAVQQAIDNNLYLRAAVYNVDFKRTFLGSSTDIGKTDIEVEYGRLNSINVDNKITVSQSFAFPTVYARQNKLSKENIKSSEAELSIKKNDIINQVKTVWWQLSYYYSKLHLLQYQDSLFNGFLFAAARKAETGETNKLEKISAESQSLESKNLINQTLADIEIFNEKLKTLLNLKESFSISDTILSKLNFSLLNDSLTISANPMLTWYFQEIKKAQLETKLEKAKLLPDLSIGYFNQSIIGTQEINGVPRIFSSSDRFTGIMAGVAVPLWFMPNKSRIKGSEINHLIIETNAESFKAALSNEFNSAIKEYSKYEGSIEYYEQSALPHAQMIIEQSNKSYLAGAMDYLEYIQNLTRALTIKNNYLETLNNYNKSVIAIEFLIGKTN